MPNTTVMFAGGGTGGHLVPGIAVAEELHRRHSSAECVFVGSERPLERTILTNAGFEQIALPVQPPRVMLRRPLRSSVGLYNSVRRLRQLFRERRPSVVIGLGGFASSLSLWFATRHKIPTILLEQNTVAGRATRLFAKRASTICTSFAETDFGGAKTNRVVVTGNPVRSKITEIYSTNSDPTHRRTLLVLGGSQGARAVNERVLSLLPALEPELQDWKIVHQTGSHDEHHVRTKYMECNLAATVSAFFPDLSQFYSEAGLVISRAGATTLSELTCAGIPSILVPYPSAKDDHQRKNARFFADAGAAIVCEQDADSNRWCESVRRLLCESAERAKMRQAMSSLAKPHAARDVTDIVMKFLPDG